MQSGSSLTLVQEQGELVEKAEGTRLTPELHLSPVQPCSSQLAFGIDILSHLKQLNRTGKYVEKKKAGVITVEMEEKLWQSGLLGDHSPQVLIDTVVYLIDMNFAPRSGEEHRHLRHFPGYQHGRYSTICHIL